MSAVKRPLLAALADDLTGAADTGLTFARLGMKTAVYLQRPSAVTTPVVIAMAESRAGPAERSAALTTEAARWMAQLEPDLFFKKIDSFIRGFPAVEMEACRRVLPGRLTVVAPACPSLDRKTIGGIHLYELRPIALTEAGRDPVAPARISSLPVLFGSTHVGLETVARGPAAVAEAVAAAWSVGQSVLSFDAALDEDLDAVVEGVGQRPALWVGSIGLSRSLALRLAGSEARAPQAPALPGGPVLLAAGSVSQVTARQLERVAADLSPALVRVRVTPGGEAEAGQEAATALRAGHSTLLIPAAPPAGEPDPAAARAMAEAMAGAVERALLAGGAIGGLLLTGGDTALAACRRLGAEALALVYEPAKDIPLLLLQGGPWDGLPVVTKGGAVGGPGELLTAVRFLQAGKA